MVSIVPPAFFFFGICLDRDMTWPSLFPINTKPGDGSIIEINVGLICLSLPVVFILFVGRLTNFSESVGSWIRERRSPRPSANESTSNLAQDDIVTPQLPSVPNNPTSLSGMRKFVRNIYHSKAQNSARGETTFTAFDDLVSADVNYHLQLKTLQSKRDEKS